MRSIGGCHVCDLRRNVNFLVLRTSNSTKLFKDRQVQQRGSQRRLHPMQGHIRLRTATRKLEGTPVGRLTLLSMTPDVYSPFSIPSVFIGGQICFEETGLQAVSWPSMPRCSVPGCFTTNSHTVRTNIVMLVILWQYTNPCWCSIALDL
jgi:hypothetical protein